MAAERNLFTRERNDGLYHVITYLLFKMVEELLLVLCMTLPVAAWTFYGIGLQGQFVLFWLNSLVTLSNGIGEWLVQCCVILAVVRSRLHAQGSRAHVCERTPSPPSPRQLHQSAHSTSSVVIVARAPFSLFTPGQVKILPLLHIFTLVYICPWPN